MKALLVGGGLLLAGITLEALHQASLMTPPLPDTVPGAANLLFHQTYLYTVRFPRPVTSGDAVAIVFQDLGFDLPDFAVLAPSIDQTTWSVRARWHGPDGTAEDLRNVAPPPPFQVLLVQTVQPQPTQGAR